MREVPLRELSLFSGAGGGLLGSKLLGWRTLGYVENNEYCQKVLRQRIADGILDAAPIFGDIRKFISEGYARSYQGMVDVVTAGFPCQPFSVAGRSKGEFDPRNMWPQTIGVIRQVRPRFALLENVPGLLAHAYFGTILGDLAEQGYDAKWITLSAGELGAHHRRERLFLLANIIKSNGNGKGNGFGANKRNGKRIVAKNIKAWTRGFNKLGAVLPLQTPTSYTRARGILYGIPHILDRHSALGNGQVPIVVKTAWEILSGRRIEMGEGL